MHNNSDHRALVLRVATDAKGVRKYEKARRTIPAPPPARPFTKGGAMFEQLVEAVEKRTARERLDNQ